MFHLTIVVMGIIIAVIFLSIVLFSIVSILIGLFGGVSSALLVKNKTFRTLLIIGCSILLFIGLLCLSPITAIYVNMPSAVISVAILIFIGMLSVAGIKFSSSVLNRIVKAILIVVFYAILIISVSLVIFISIINNL